MHKSTTPIRRLPRYTSRAATALILYCAACHQYQEKPCVRRAKNLAAMARLAHQAGVAPGLMLVVRLTIEKEQ